SSFQPRIPADDETPLPTNRWVRWARMLLASSVGTTKVVLRTGVMPSSQGSRSWIPITGQAKPAKATRRSWPEAARTAKVRQKQDWRVGAEGVTSFGRPHVESA